MISPEGIAVAPDGTVYVSDWYTGIVSRINADGSLAPVAGGGPGLDGPAIGSNLFGPTGLAIDRNGSLYVADVQGGTIRKISTGQISTFYRDIRGPWGLAFDSSGALYVSEFCCGSSDQIGHLVRLDARGQPTEIDLSALPPPAVYPGYVAFDSAGNLYMGDRAPVATGPWATLLGGCRIMRMTPDGRFSVIAGTGKCGFSGDGGPAVSAELNNPSGIVLDSIGNLYFADSNNHRIRRIDKQGIITTVAGTGLLGYSGDGGPATQAGLGWPAGLGITSGDLIYIADAYDTPPGRVRVLRLFDDTITAAVSAAG